MKFYVEWITTRYGEMSLSFARVGGTEVHVATVAVMNGVAIGMGESRDHAIYDLYEDLRSAEISTPLEGYWRTRREKLKPTQHAIASDQKFGGDA